MVNIRQGFSSVQFSLLSNWVVGEHEGRLNNRDPLTVFSAGGPCEQFWHGQRCSLLVVVHPAFPLPTAASLPLQIDLEDGFGAVVACDMSKACKFSSLDSCQKWFLWTRKEVGLAPHPVVGLVLQVAAVEKFPHALGFKSLDPFFSQQAGSKFHSHSGRWR